MGKLPEFRWCRYGDSDTKTKFLQLLLETPLVCPGGRYPFLGGNRQQLTVIFRQAESAFITLQKKPLSLFLLCYKFPKTKSGK